MDDTAFTAIVAAPGFNIGICATADEITELDYLVPGPEIAPQTALAKEAVAQLHAYLRDPAFVFSLPLAPAGTPFQHRVWEGIRAIAPGQTLTYAALAAAVSSGPRAVGNACGANPYPVIVPCHRVVASGGGLGGFSRQRGGFLLEVKRWLLAHEYK